MGGFNRKYLVLIHSTAKGNDGKDEHIYGTGYFVNNELVLTARHVLSAGSLVKMEVRLEVSEPGDKSPWVEANKQPVWENAGLDAALIKIIRPIEEVEPTPWGETNFEQDKHWKSVAYPEASSEKKEGQTEFKTSGLEGTLYAHGGGGQGIRDLELGVEHESKWWNGISGAPVFVDDKLVGIIKSSLSSYDQRRLAAVPVDLLLQDPGFRTTIAQKWLQPFPQKNWVLVLISENGNSELADIVQAAINNKSEEINRVTGQTIDSKPCVVNVTEALETPERMFQFIQAICAAPIMVVDVTDFQPAVMLFLGIRAVVRRGITITTINKTPDESALSQLPFNIQETKLIYLSTQQEVDSPRHPTNWIGSAITSGLIHLKNDPAYLDLPAYDAVRCPKPKNLASTPSIPDKILMLCSFNRAYKKYWNYVSNKITLSKNTISADSPKSLERMIDISSPRLVGRALYESIRWTHCCIVDWTHWRANVFFELGVRYSCSDIGPISVIEEHEIIRDDKTNIEPETAPNYQTKGKPGISSRNQRKQLYMLLEPVVYKLNGSTEPFKEAFTRYNAMINNQEMSLKHSAIAHNAIYETIVNSYEWAQEPITRLPHEELQADIEARFGKDPQQAGAFQILFSTNPDFAKQLRSNMQERWIAAWAYFLDRYSPEEFRSDRKLRAQLIAMGEYVAQSLSTSPDPNHKRIREGIVDLIDELGAM